MGVVIEGNEEFSPVFPQTLGIMPHLYIPSILQSETVEINERFQQNLSYRIVEEGGKQKLTSMDPQGR